MILHVASDIHFEFMSLNARAKFLGQLKDQIAKDKPDLLVIAGDIGLLDRDLLLVRLEELHHMYPGVVYVPGNHEFFGTSIRGGHDKLDKFAADHSGFIFLRPGISGQSLGVRFRGGTLWYPDAEEIYKRNWIDYRRIHDSDTEIEVEHQAFLKQDGPVDVVVSHHFPTTESIHPDYAGVDSNIFFCAEIDETLMEWEIKKALPKLWIHGHTHMPFDYVSKFGFRVYCNPHGYPEEGTNPNFFDRLRVEVQ